MNQLSTNIVVNYNDHDPISLEKIDTLQVQNVFFVKNKITNKMYAYDAKNWFIYISENKKHPITKQYLTKNEFWELYLTVRQSLSFIKINDPELYPLINQALQKYHSNKIKFIKINNKKHKVIPISPLFIISIKKLTKVKYDNTKTYHLIYSLIDSRNSKNKIFTNLSATITCDKTIELCFGFY